MLIDTGIVSTPSDVILPFFGQAGFDPLELDYIFISHADVDHFGGNAALRVAAPQALFISSAIDAPIISDRKRALIERYGWYAQHGPDADYDAETKALLESGMGDDVEMDIKFTGGEWFRLDRDWHVQAIELPGHSAGHLGIWDPASRSAFVIDAVLGAGLYNFDHEIIHPPPYVNAASYEATIASLIELSPDWLLTAHYEVMEGVEVKQFLDTSAAFVARARAATRAAVKRQEQVSLASLLAELNDELGPYSSFPNELAGPIRAHLQELVAEGVVEPVGDAAPPAWRWIK